MDKFRGLLRRYDFLLMHMDLTILSLKLIDYEDLKERKKVLQEAIQEVSNNPSMEARDICNYQHQIKVIDAFITFMKVITKIQKEAEEGENNG